MPSCRFDCTRYTLLIVICFNEFLFFSLVVVCHASHTFDSSNSIQFWIISSFEFLIRWIFWICKNAPIMAKYWRSFWNILIWTFWFNVYIYMCVFSIVICGLLYISSDHTNIGHTRMELTTMYQHPKKPSW